MQGEGVGSFDVALPVVPLPPAPFQGSIYENQTTAQNKYFERREPAKV